VTLEDDYLHATRTLRDLNALDGKVTAEARHRIAAHTLREQLEAHLADLRKEFDNDQSDVTAAFDADKSWSGQHARLHPKGWDAGV
jgi:hypothetical protein